MKNAKILLYTLFLLCSYSTANAQDIHFSQFYHSPQNLNPALVGVFKGDYRGVANYRSQWASVPVAYTTFAFGGDGKIMPLFGLGTLNGGLQVNLDKAGDGEMTLGEVSLAAGYNLRLTREMSLSLGLNYGFSSRRFNPDLLTWANQFNGDQFQENLGSGETLLLDNTTFTKFGAGFNMHYEIGKKSRTQIDMGAALHQINRPKNSFFQDPNVQLAARLTFYGDAWVQFHPKMDIKGHALWHVQGDFSRATAAEFVVGTGLRYHLNLRPDREQSIAFLTSYRSGGAASDFGDAIIPSIELGYRSWTAAFSYDINISEFQIATNKRGGPELALIYIFTKVAPPEVFKACPVF